MDHQAIVSHISDHLHYPATKAELVQACNEMADVPAEDKAWLIRNLPEGQYEGPEEVIEALGWAEPLM